MAKLTLFLPSSRKADSSCPRRKKPPRVSGSGCLDENRGSVIWNRCRRYSAGKGRWTVRLYRSSALAPPARTAELGELCPRRKGRPRQARPVCRTQKGCRGISEVGNYPTQFNDTCRRIKRQSTGLSLQRFAMPWGGAEGIGGQKD